MLFLKRWVLRFLGSVFVCWREDLKEKSGRLKDFVFSSFLFFLTGPDEQSCVAFTFIPITISERRFYRKVYNIFSEDRHRKANDNLFHY